MKRVIILLLLFLFPISFVEKITVTPILTIQPVASEYEGEPESTPAPEEEPSH